MINQRHVPSGSIGFCLTGKDTDIFDIKPESVDRKGRIGLGQPVSLWALNSKLTALRGKPLVAYTNRRVHIWAVLDYDARGSRVLIRNPRRPTSEWITVSQFRERFQLMVYAP